MKKWLIALLIVLAIGAIIYLDQNNIIGWQPLSMIIAAIAGPFKLLLGFFGDKEAEIREKHAAIRQREAEYQSQLEGKISSSQKRIELISQEIEVIDQQLELLKKKRAQIDAEVERMSPEEKKAAFRKYFGS